MKVTLINFNADETIANLAAAVCIDKYKEAIKNFIPVHLTAAFDSRHFSVLEHLPLTWLIEDISRSCSHQLVRHRIASYSQKSQRYTKVDNYKEWFVVPQSIKNSNYINDYEYIMETIGILYSSMCNSGIPKEDARMVLPEACFTSIIVSMNARAFIEAVTLRTCNRAQWEIREVFTKMRETIKGIYPRVYKECFPNCCKNIGCLEAKPCNNPYKKEVDNVNCR